MAFLVSAMIVVLAAVGNAQRYGPPPAPKCEDRTAYIDKTVSAPQYVTETQVQVQTQVQTQYQTEVVVETQVVPQVVVETATVNREVINTVTNVVTETQQQQVTLTKACAQGGGGSGGATGFTNFGTFGGGS